MERGAVVLSVNVKMKFKETDVEMNSCSIIKFISGLYCKREGDYFTDV